MRRRSSLQAVIFLSILCSVSPAGSLWVSPNDFNVAIVEGTALTETLTITNDGYSAADFTIRTRQISRPGMSTARNGYEAGAEGTFVSSISAGQDFTKAANVPYKAGELIVRFAPKANGRQRNAAEKRAILSSLGGGSIKREFRIVPGLCTVRLPAGMKVEQALQKFNRMPGVVYAHPDYEVSINSTIPNDTRFNELWGMNNTGQSGGTIDADIDAPEAWDMGTGSGDVVVAVIDTGVDYTHPELAGNMWTNEAELHGSPGVDDDHNGYIDDIYGYDFYNNDGNPMDDHYHGTHCAGTIGAIGNNGAGVAGVCWHVKIMALKFLNSQGSGYSSDAIEAVQYSVLMGANLSSNSWGGGGYDQGLKDAIDAAGAAGMLFVAAAGNDSRDTDSAPQYPSCFDSASIISVMATDKYDKRSNFSNWGAVSVDLGAPGTEILSCQPGGGYQYLSGTSMATPHVAGACALLWSLDPAMSNQEVKDALLASVDPTLPGLCVSGGRLNLYNATLEVSAPWIEVEPEEGVIDPCGWAELSVTFNAIGLAPGLYEGEIVVVSDSVPEPIVVPVSLTVSADDLAVTPAEGFESTGEKGGPFEPQCATYTLTNNNDAESVSWATEHSDWLVVEPNEGVIDPYESVEVSVCISPDANLFEPNIYTDPLTFMNTDSGSIKLRSVKLTVKPPDCFTQSFDGTGSSLKGLTVTFMPNGSTAYYEACHEEANEFPTDPNGGTYVALWDDDSAEVLLPEDTNILFYGTRYDRFYIGSNGYITFGDGDTEYDGSLESHFNMPRISGVFTDLLPGSEQCISYKLLADRAVVTFKDVQVFGQKNSKNSFQVEMFYRDGAICITWLDVTAVKFVAGLSGGHGLPPAFFEESKLGKYPPCWPWCDLDRDYRVDFTDFAILAGSWLEEDCNVPYWCGRGDLDLSGAVEMPDVGVFAEDWLTKIDWFQRPVAWWKMDEETGTIAHDSAGDSNGVCLGGLSFDNDSVPGVMGNAIHLDGVDDRVYASSMSLPREAFTLAMWFRPDEDLSSGSSRMDLIHWQVNQRPHLTFNFNGGGYIYLDVAVDGQQYDDVKTTTNFWEGSRWYHIAAVFDGETFRIYVDAASECDVAHPGTHNSASGIYIGSHRTNGVDSFDGTIDDVRIYDRALSADEIGELYREGAPHRATAPYPPDGAQGVEPNVVLSWTAGKGAVSHNVYLGTDFDDVNDANTSSPVYKGNVAANSFDPHGLEGVTTYYWRIDEVAGSSVYRGDVWSFTTAEGPPDKATVPEPNDGAEGVSPDTILSWTAGRGAVSHDVYLGTSLADVNDANTSSPVYRGNVATNSFDPCGLEEATTYYWRIDELDGLNIYKGFVWSFTTLEGLPDKATAPEPNDGAEGVSPDTILSWTAGRGAISHDVYLGTGFADVNEANTSSPVYMGNVATNSFDPCGLEEATTYYWRIDELDGSNTYKGDVWSFATRYVSQGLVGWWKVDEETGTVAHDSAGDNNGICLGGLSFDNDSVPGKVGNAIHLDGVDDRIYASSMSLPREAFTMAMWFRPDVNLSSSSSRMELIHWQVNQRPHLTFNFNGGGYIYLDVAVDGQQYDDVKTTTNFWEGSRWYHIAAVFDGNDFRIYVNAAPECKVSHPGTHDSASGIYIGSHRLGGAYSFDGTIDDVRVYDRALSADEIAELYYGKLLGKATAPEPNDGAEDIDPNIVLGWRAGKNALSHDVYLGVDFNDVNDANTSWPVYMGNFDTNSYDPCGLGDTTTYYWRIDEVAGSNVRKGDIWSFTTLHSNSGPVSWWALDEDTGTVAHDTAGGNDGVLLGGLSFNNDSVPGVIGNAIHLDGVNDRIYASSVSLPRNAFTLAMWFRPDANLSSSSSRMDLIHWEVNQRPHLSINYAGDGSVCLAVSVDGVGYDDVKTTTDFWEGSKWYHIAAVFDGNDFRIYVDAAPECNVSHPGAHDTASGVYIGSHRTNGVCSFDGTIDDVRIYDRALSGTEVGELYQQGAAMRQRP
jgi:subtilisin family serine protease